MQINEKYKVVVIGGSAGSLKALILLLSNLPAGFLIPLIAVVHLHPSGESGLIQYFKNKTSLLVKEALDKDKMLPGTFYLAPSGYHLLIEPDGTFCLSIDEKVNYARPSIDVLFESAAFAFGDKVIAILLTGSNLDGAEGICKIKHSGGLTIAQDPVSAEYPVMPRHAIETGNIDLVLTIPEMCTYLKRAIHYA